MKRWSSAPKMNEALSPALIVNPALTSKIDSDLASSLVFVLPIHWAPSQAPILVSIRPVEKRATSETVSTPRLSTTRTRHQ